MRRKCEACGSDIPDPRDRGDVEYIGGLTPCPVCGGNGLPAYRPVTARRRRELRRERVRARARTAVKAGGLVSLVVVASVDLDHAPMRVIAAVYLPAMVLMVWSAALFGQDA